MPFYVTLVAGLVCTFYALRFRYWWLALLGCLLTTPIALVANVAYSGLIVVPLVQLAFALALRWSAGPLTWIGLIGAAVAIWFFGVASIIVLHWPITSYWILVIGFLGGMAALGWSRPPWMADRRGLHSTP